MNDIKKGMSKSEWTKCISWLIWFFIIGCVCFAMVVIYNLSNPELREHGLNDANSVVVEPNAIGLGDPGFE